ncbi:sulfatase-like hydrolase/transferase [Candidatus Gracilibacteria bacterium]|nr:sulfatase-like hydrolase/transferase [Candidatus Gracilibacteria bacterium]
MQNKTILLGVLAVFVMFISHTSAYTPSASLQSKLERVVEKVEGVIDQRGEEYRLSFLVSIKKYQQKYSTNIAASYVLNYLFSEISQGESPNILLIIADDMGLDAMPGFSEGFEKPNIPNLETLMSNGLTFENMWSAPVCTPTRATILTGRYGVKTGVLKVDDELSIDETSLQSMLDNKTQEGYNHAVIGKWHLSKDASHPTSMGVDYYAGLLTGGAKSYTNWRLTENSTTSTNTEYITTKFTDLAIDWVSDQDEKPWFLWLAYTAPHTPFHLPPSDLHDRELSGDQDDIDNNPIPYYMAAIEAMDSEIGRLLDSIPQSELDNTVIVFIGDNGTPGQAIQYPYSRKKAKGSLYQGGINVPMFVSGYGVDRQGEREDTLVHTVDIFATVLDIANTGVSKVNDSTSFKDFLTDENTQQIEIVYGEVGTSGKKTGGYTIRDTEYKLIVFTDGQQELYNLVDDPYENNNLARNNNYKDIISDLISEADKIRK